MFTVPESNGNHADESNLKRIKLHQSIDATLNVIEESQHPTG